MDGWDGLPSESGGGPLPHSHPMTTTTSHQSGCAFHPPSTARPAICPTHRAVEALRANSQAQFQPIRLGCPKQGVGSETGRERERRGEWVGDWPPLTATGSTKPVLEQLGFPKGDDDGTPNPLSLPVLAAFHRKPLLSLYFYLLRRRLALSTPHHPHELYRPIHL